MYRRLTSKQQEKRKRRIDALRQGRERAALAREPRGRMPELPLLRREILVVDYDSGGWSTALAGLRKAFQRLPSPRSDFWWEA